jgi:hypothetical protein
MKELQKHSREAVRDHCDEIIAAGGDGTFNEIDQRDRKARRSCSHRTHSARYW